MTDTSTSVVFAPQFAGPPDSANGGYACGVTAEPLDGTIEATLRRPPPIGIALDLTTSRRRSVLSREGEVVVEAVSTDDVAFDAPDPVSPAEMGHALDRFDPVEFASAHPFPGCFTCGPERARGSGLRLFCVVIKRARPLTGWPLVVEPWMADDSGTMRTPLLWAALDCPSGWAWTIDDRARDVTCVLGRLTARIERNPSVGERLAIAGWATGRDGRRLSSSVAIWDEQCTLVAAGRAIWIALDPRQIADFKALPGGQRTLSA